MKKIYMGVVFFVFLLLGGTAFAGSGSLVVTNGSGSGGDITVTINDTTTPSMGCNPSQMTIGSGGLESTTNCTWDSGDQAVMQVTGTASCRFTSLNDPLDTMVTDGCQIYCPATDARFQIIC